MLVADAVEFNIDLGRLWAGEFYLPEVVLSHPELALEANADGRRNWYFNRTQDDAAATVRIGRLRVDRGEAIFHDPSRRTEIRAKLQTVDAAGGVPSGVRFEAGGVLLALPFAASGSGGPVLALAEDSRPYPIKFHAALGGSQADVDGVVGGVTALRTVDVQLGLRGPDFAALYPLLGVALPPTPPYALSGRLRRSGHRLTYEGLHGRVGSSDLAGSVTVDLAGKKPAVNAELVSERLDLADLGPLIGAGPEAVAAGSGDRILPDRSFPIERWRSADMDVQFRGRRLLHATRMPLDDFRLHAYLRDSVLILDPLDFGAGGADFAFKVILDGRSAPLRGEVHAHLRKLSWRQAAAADAAADIRLGDISADIDLVGRGESVARMLASADGGIDLAVGDGEVSKLMLKLAGLDVGGYLWTRLSGDRRVPISCAVGSFKADNGVLQTKLLLLDTPDTSILGAGRIDLRDESLALILRPLPKKPSLPSLRAPLRVAGSLAHPRLGPETEVVAARAGAAVGLALVNPLALLLPLIETGPGRDSDCGRLLRRGLQPAASPG